jgi:serine/threonine protein kinase
MSSGGSSAVPLGKCVDVNNYERIAQIGEGTYGLVFMARDKKTGQIVALKKVRMEAEKDGFPVTALREIQVVCVLVRPRRPCVSSSNERCRFCTVFRTRTSCDSKTSLLAPSWKASFWCSSASRSPASARARHLTHRARVVGRYCSHDLSGLMERMSQPFSEAEVKRIMLQLLSAVSFMHSRWILHRDLKMSNVLYTDKGEIKLAGRCRRVPRFLSLQFTAFCCRFRPRATIWRLLREINAARRHALVPLPRTPVR